MEGPQPAKDMIEFTEWMIHRHISFIITKLTTHCFLESKLSSRYRSRVGKIRMIFLLSHFIITSFFLRALCVYVPPNNFINFLSFFAPLIVPNVQLTLLKR